MDDTEINDAAGVVSFTYIEGETRTTRTVDRTNADRTVDVAKIGHVVDEAKISYAMEKILAHMLTAIVTGVDVEEAIILAHASGSSAVYAVVAIEPLKFQVVSCDDGVTAIQNITPEMMQVLQGLSDHLIAHPIGQEDMDDPSTYSYDFQMPPRKQVDTNPPSQQQEQKQVDDSPQ